MSRAVVSWIDHHARRIPDRIALVDLHRRRETSYGELAARVRSLAWSLQDQFGVGPGGRVAVLSRNDTRVFEVIYACGLLGAIAVPLNWRLTAAELDRGRPPTPSRACSSTRARRPARRRRWPRGRTSWCASPGPARTASRTRYEQLATGAVPDGWAPADVDEDAVWTIIYTSGTTGLPKGVQATHGAVLASMLGILVAHRVSAASRCLTVLPTFHVAGLNLFANPVLYAGGTVVVARAFDPAQTLALLTDDVRPDHPLLRCARELPVHGGPAGVRQRRRCGRSSPWSADRRSRRPWWSPGRRAGSP